jgi:hypothetical protein
MIVDEKNWRIKNSVVSNIDSCAIKIRFARNRVLRGFCGVPRLAQREEKFIRSFKNIDFLRLARRMKNYLACKPDKNLIQ